MSFPSNPTKEFSDALANFHHFGGDESVRQVIAILGREIRKRESFVDSPSDVVVALRNAHNNPAATVEMHTDALWKALPYLKPRDQGYGSLDTKQIWTFLVEQAHRHSYLSDADLASYDGKRIIEPSSPAPTLRSTYRSEGPLTRAGRAIANLLARILRKDGSTFD